MCKDIVLQGSMLKYRDAITQHMAFLGYEFFSLTNTETKEGSFINDWFDHSSKLTIVIRYLDTFIFLMYFYTCDDFEVNLDKIHEINADWFAKVIYNKESNDLIFTCYVTHYEKEHFTFVLNNFSNAIVWMIDTFRS